MVKLILIFTSLLVIQLYFFSDYLTIYSRNEIKVKGLACTCPDQKVISGINYLKSITPDSLKKYNIDYSEIYVSYRPAVGRDYQGVGEYYIKGEVIGKKRVSEGSTYWNPYIQVESWREVNGLKSIVIKLFFWLQVLIYSILIFFNYRRVIKSL